MEMNEWLKGEKQTNWNAFSQTHNETLECSSSNTLPLRRIEDSVRVWCTWNEKESNK